MDHPAIAQIERTGLPPRRYEFRGPAIGLCSCGCGEIIRWDYEHIRWDDLYFTYRSHLIRYMKDNLDLEEVG